MPLCGMQEMDVLTANLAQLKKHIESQDVEIYRQQRLIDSLRVQLQKLQERVESLAEGGGGSSMPADEKPPHY